VRERKEGCDAVCQLDGLDALELDVMKLLPIQEDPCYAHCSRTRAAST
jgi:hypothetical protein